MCIEIAKLIICAVAKIKICQGAGGVQSVKRPTPGFSSGHDLTVREFEPCIGLHADSVEPAWDSLSVFLSLSPDCTLCVSQNE